MMNDKTPQERQLELQQKELTVKQAKWLDLYIKLGNGTEAAMQAYDCQERTVAAAISSQNFRKLNISELLEGMGMTKKAILQMAVIGMTKPEKTEMRLVRVKKTVQKGDKTVEITTDEVRPVQVPDYGVRHKYWADIAKMHQLIPTAGGTTNNFQAEEMNFVYGDSNRSKPEEPKQEEPPILTTEQKDP